MFIAIIFVVALLAIASLGPKINVENAKAAKIGDLRFPRSNYGDPIPYVSGTVRQRSPIVCWYGDYDAVPLKKKVPTGLFSSKYQTYAHRHYLGIDCILALGPDVILKKAWSGKKLFWEGELSVQDSVVIDLPDLFGGDEEKGGLSGTFTFFPGDYDTDQSEYLLDVIGPDVPSYNGYARVLFEHFYIGTQVTPDVFSFEISKLTTHLHATYSIMPNGLDSNPMETVYDVMTNKWGRFGNSDIDIDLPSFLESAEILYNEGIGVSILIQSPISGKDFLEEIMRVAEGILYEEPTTNKIISKLIRYDYDIEDLDVFDESSVIELRNFSKTTWENTYNQCRVSFRNRLKDYDNDIAVEHDFANINFQGKIKPTKITVNACADPEVALKLAARQLSLLSIPLFKFDLVANRTAHLKRPGDVFILNWEEYGIENMVARICEIDFGTLENNSIILTCVQDRFAIATPTFLAPELSGWVPVSLAPTEIVLYVIFTPPAFLSFSSDDETIEDFDDYGRVFIIAIQPGRQSVSHDILYSEDDFDTDPIYALTDNSYSGGGVMDDDYLATVAADDRHDTTGFTVSSVSARSLAQLKQYTTLTEARDGSAMLLINDELFVYVGFTDNEDGSVTFDDVYRGILDTVPEDHDTNDRVWFISDISGLVPQAVEVSDAAYFKLIDKTATGSFPISDADTISTTVTNRAGLPLPVAYLTLNSSRDPDPIAGAGSVTIAWRNRSRLDPSLRVYDDATDTREPGTQTRIAWRMDAGSYTTVLTTANSVELDISGLAGTLEVLVDSRIIESNKYSMESELITAVLTEDAEEMDPFYFPGLFDGTYLVGTGDLYNNPTNLVYSDDDGETWTVNTNSIGFVPTHLVNGLGLYVAATNHWFGVASSPSGTWTSDTVGSEYVNDLIFDGTEFIAARNDKLLSSTDGEAWTNETHDLVGLGVIKKIHKFGSNYFMVFQPTAGGTKVYKSSDLATWTLSYNNVTVADGNIKDICDANGTLFAVGSQTLSFRSRPFLLSSTDDGATWVDVSPVATTTNPAGMSISGVFYIDSKYVVLAGVDFEAFSADLVTWTVDEPGLGYAYSAKYAVMVGTKLITVRYYSGTSTELVYTEDGETWTTIVL